MHSMGGSARASWVCLSRACSPGITPTILIVAKSSITVCMVISLIRPLSPTLMETRIAKMNSSLLTPSQHRAPTAEVSPLTTSRQSILPTVVRRGLAPYRSTFNAEPPTDYGSKCERSSKSYTVRIPSRVSRAHTIHTFTMATAPKKDTMVIHQ